MVRDGDEVDDGVVGIGVGVEIDEGRDDVGGKQGFNTGKRL